MPQEQHRATSRILDLLELLSGADGAGYTLTELSQALHIPKSSLFSIIHTLEERRYVHCDKHSGQYSIGISCCFANKLRKFFKQSAKKKRRLKGF